MRYKRFIWFTLFLICCLVGGGLYYSTTVEKFPCKIALRKETLSNWLHLLLDYDSLVFRLKQCASTVNEEPSDWQRVEVFYVEKQGWQCRIYKPGDDKNEESLRIHLNDNGEQDIFFIPKRFPEMWDTSSGNTK
jgi:hypothetical protein